MNRENLTEVQRAAEREVAKEVLRRGIEMTVRCMFLRADTRKLNRISATVHLGVLNWLTKWAEEQTAGDSPSEVEVPA